MSTDKTICLNSKVNGKQPSTSQRVYDVGGVSMAITCSFLPSIAEPVPVAMRGRNPNNPSERGKSNGQYKQRIEMNKSGVANTITSVQKDSMVAEPQVIGNIYPSQGQNGNIYSCDGISPTINAGVGVKGRGIGSCNAPKITEPNIIKRGNYSTSGHNASTIVDGDGISPTVMENHGTVTAVVEPQVLTPKRTEYGKAIRKQYESHEIEMSRHDMTTMEPRTDGITNTLTSVQKDNYLAIPEATSKGYAEAYEGDSVNLAVPNSKTRRGRVGNQMANTLDTGCQQGVEVKHNNISNGKTRVFEAINETNTREVLCVLRSKIGEEAYQRQIGRYVGLLKEEVLQQRVYEKSLCKNREDTSGEWSSTPLFEKDCLPNQREGDDVRDMWFNKECRCASQRLQLSEQFRREFNDIVSQLPYEDAQTKECVSYLWRACEGSQSLQQTLNTMEEVWRSPAQTVEYTQTPKYRIRKLTVRECFRLMGVDDADIDKLLSAGISNSQLYKCAGNSIVVDTLYHIFRKAFIDTGNENLQQTLF